MSSPYRFAHLHGFSSDQNSTKGLHLRNVFQSRGETLHLPELNRPSFERLTFTAALDALDRLDAEHPGGPWRISASSMGGYLASIWASRNPEKVDRMVLLCPGFDLASRFIDLVGARRMEEWKREGALPLPAPDEELRPVHWKFIEDARTFPPTPLVPCETLIFHGRQDPTIPISSSREYADHLDHVTLHEVDDDHGLIKTLPMITDELLRFFEV